MAYSLAEINRLHAMLSVERLKPLVDLTKSAEAAIELHQESLRVGASSMAIIATLEIALRNSVCDNLENFFGVPNWLLQPPITLQWRKPELNNLKKALDSAKRAEYSKLAQSGKNALDAIAYPNGRPLGKSHLDRSKDRRKQINVSNGKVVAELTLFFWKRLFGPEYEHSLWKTTLKRTFPNKGISRAAVAVELEYIYQSRNRLAHHEAVLRGRFSKTCEAIEFVTQNLAENSRNYQSPLFLLIQPDLQNARSLSETLHSKFDRFKQQ